MKAKDHAQVWQRATDAIRDQMKVGAPSYDAYMPIWYLASFVAHGYHILAKEQEEQDV